MALTGKQKAAMLLMSLDAGTATELLKGVNPELIQELALEVAHLDSVGYHSGRHGTRIARQFCDSLQDEERINFKNFLRQMLENAAFSEKEKRIRTQIKDLKRETNPFARIRVFDSRTIATILKEEHPRSAAVVLSELPVKKGSDVLNLLGVGIRLSAVERMQTCKNMTVEAKTHIGRTICERLDTATEDEAVKALQAGSKRKLGKMALIVQKLGKGCRTGLFKVIPGKGKKTSEGLQKQFTQEQVDHSPIAWMDIPQVDDDLLQEALNEISTKQLALALVKADFVTIQKITSNISEPAAAALREETSRISNVGNEEIQDTRKEILRILHQMNMRN